MRVLIDLSEVTALTARAEKELEGSAIADEMKRVVEMGAAFERSSHGYRNRTGRLEASTKGRMVNRTQRLSRVDLEMGYTPSADYASHVVRMGLSNINSAAARVEAELAERFSVMAKRIAG